MLINTMWKIIILSNQKKKAADRGFVTLEIIIALLIAFGFLMVSLQTLVAAMAFKVQAQEKQKADKLIQEDVERLNDLGSIAKLTFGADKLQACSGDANNDGTANDGYSQQLWANLQADTPDGDDDLEVKLLSVVKSGGTEESGKTLTLTRTQLPVTTSGDPNRILGISYQVNDSDGNLIAQRYVEVIPDEALECP
jgi:hypothetical protein